MYNFDHLCVMESLKPNFRTNIPTPCLRSYFIPQHFSSCSTSTYADYLNSKNPECLLNIPDSKDLIQPAVCGNSFVETGEECDCGTVQVSRLYGIPISEFNYLKCFCNKLILSYSKCQNTKYKCIC